MFCDKVKEFLSQKGVVYQERNVMADEFALQELQKLGYMTTPVVLINGEVIVGFDQGRLEAALAEE
jgi:glutaredoxin